MDYHVRQRYEKFLSRVKYTYSPYGIPIWNFRDVLNIGAAMKLDKQGDPRFVQNRVQVDFVEDLGFTEEEIIVLFSRQKVTQHRKMTLRKNSRLYRQRKGAISYIDRRRRNVEDFKKILQLKKKKFTQAQIAGMLDMPFNRVRYLIQEYNRR
ncbi:hypothetical protein DEAC_c43820 [Desulfosporosinus acididurans]|uniref:Uncharacterized protein n=1 Tax=Desulfosporosinus acididurans TaxID=476652 RepID=A0A0J1IG32_9FIRM|nr:hypothetical protein [Desulfosporosinus acididurans]KLU63696.1 hypothetical protein DEAC_c43820 [Desulfosporosinus acididurans]